MWNVVRIINACTLKNKRICTNLVFSAGQELDQDVLEIFKIDVVFSRIRILGSYCLR